jgi:hypothetical protein
MNVRRRDGSVDIAPLKLEAHEVGPRIDLDRRDAGGVGVTANVWWRTEGVLRDLLGACEPDLERRDV